jgi:uncharacterized protein
LNILIAGGLGFIGRHLSRHLVCKGHQVTILTRKDPSYSGAVSTLHWDGQSFHSDHQWDVVVNLCGLDIGASRWSIKRKQALLDSRLAPTQALVDWILAQPKAKRPRLLNASAIGFYQDSKQSQTESNYANSAELTFPQSLVRQWEDVVLQGRKRGLRASCLRFGVVLGRDGGIIKRLYWLHRLGLGLVMGDKKRPLSWVHIDDVCRIVDHLMALDDWLPAYNAVAPTTTTWGMFSKVFAQQCRRPCLLQLPDVVIKRLFGEMGERLLMVRHTIRPACLLDAGFNFKYSNIRSAFVNLIQ